MSTPADESATFPCCNNATMEYNSGLTENTAYTHRYIDVSRFKLDLFLIIPQQRQNHVVTVESAMCPPPTFELSVDFLARVILC